MIFSPAHSQKKYSRIYMYYRSVLKSLGVGSSVAIPSRKLGLRPCSVARQCSQLVEETLRIML